MNWGKTEHKASRFLKELDADDLNEQLDAVRSYLADLASSFGGLANRQWGRARHRASHLSAREAEDMMKDNLAASLVVALGVGVLVGYLIRRGTE